MNEEEKLEKKIPFLHPGDVARGVRLVRLLELAAVADARVEFGLVKDHAWEVIARFDDVDGKRKISGFAAELREASETVIEALERLLRRESHMVEVRVARLRAIGFDGSEEGGKTDAAAE